MGMTERLTGQFIPGSSLLHRLDARAKLFGFILLTASVILADTVAGYALIIAIMLLLTAVSGLPLSTVVGSVKRMFWFFVLIFIMNSLFYSTENAIWSWWIISVSKAGIIQGFNVMFRILIILVLSNIFTLVTPPLEISSAIQSMLKPLKLLRLPADDIAMIISVAIQFIPTLLQEADTIKMAQIARGARFESRKLHERAAAMLPLIVPMFLSAFKRADELATAMEARGYRSAKSRSGKKAAPLPLGSYASILFCAAVCAAEIII